MPQRLKHRQQKIQEKRKQTPRRDFVKEICSWMPVTFSKNNEVVSRFPNTSRSPKVQGIKDILENEVILEKSLGKGFFKDLSYFFQQSHLPAVMHFQSTENSMYGDTVVGSRNVYIGKVVTFNCDGVYYSINIKDGSTDIFNSHNVFDHSSQVYQSTNISRGNKIFWSTNCINCSDTWHCQNLVGCTHCLWCHDLENRSYCINNEQYSEKEYHKTKEKYFLSGILAVEPDSLDIGNLFVGSDAIEHGSGMLINCHESIHIVNGINMYRCRNGFDNGANDPLENAYDIFICGRSTHFYGIGDSGGFSEHVYCSYNIGRSSNIFYSYYLENCSYCLGCIGLKNKSFCIFNKQYTKEEWFDKVDEIFSAMEKEGTLGDFFPGSMNPFYFNDTTAYLIDDSFTKEEVEAEGYLRRDEAIKVDIPDGAKVVKTNNLNQYEGFDNEGNWKIDPEILKVIIQDEQGNVYCIVLMELKFLQKHGLSLPRLHRLDRLKMNFKIQ